MLGQRGSWRSFGAVLLCSAALLSGCKGKENSAPSPSASGSAAAEATPCDAYANRMCELAGVESPTCQVMRAAGEVMAPSACSAGLKDIAFSQAKITKDQKVCDYLVQQVCAAVGPQTKTCAKITSETSKFTVKKCQAMTAHLPEVIAEVKGMQLANEAVSPERQAAMTNGAAIAFGPPTARVQLVEFTDFECAACGRMAHLVEQLQQKYADRVRFTFRQFPLSKHPNAHLAAEASLIANQQGKFWPMHDRLFDHQTELDAAGLKTQAKAAGLDLAAFDKALTARDFGSAVDDDIKLGESVGVERTPAVYVNGVHVDYAAELPAVTKMIETALNSELN